MLKLVPRAIAPALLAVLTAACASASRSASGEVQPITLGPDGNPVAAKSTARGRAPYTPADVDFMTGMIPHHAQAILISNWAESHGARRDVAVLAARIIVAQSDEIALIQAWLRTRNLPVPAADATHHRMTMNGMTHDMLMPGMLTADELKQLDAARGSEWDRLFLTFMIRHHQGALDMVDTLYAKPGTAQDEDVFRLAADVQADQSTEIARMEIMLAATPPGRTP